MALESSRIAFERAKGSVGGGVGSGLRAAMRPHPLFVREARGAHVWDLDGDRYVDYVMAWGPLVLGHGDPRINEAVAEVATRMQVVGTGHELEYLAAEAVLDAVPHGERLLWSNTGTEAVQVALRLARAATGRRRVLKFARSYHGWHDSVYAGLEESDSGRPPVPASKGQSPSGLDDLIVARFNDAAMAEQLLREAVERDIAAVLVDPILSNGGVEAPEPDFLPTLRASCDRHGVVLIFDEVIAGFRIARGGAAEKYGVRPDLSVFGKAMAGGFTQSAVVGRADLIDQVDDGVVHAGTFNGNPIALAAVEATMRVLADPAVYDTLSTISAYFGVVAGAALDTVPGSGSFNRVGSLLQYVPADGATGLHGTGGLWGVILEGMLRQGFLFMPSGKVFLSTAHTTSDVEATAEALEKVLRQLSPDPHHPPANSKTGKKEGSAMTTLTTLDASCSTEEAIAVIDRDGGVIIRDFFDGDVLKELRSDIDVAMASTPWGQDDFSGHRTKRLYGIFQHTQHAATTVRHPHYAGIAQHFLEVPKPVYLGEDLIELTPTYQVGVSSIIDIHPGEGAQPLHRDDTVWQWRHPDGYRQARVQIMVAVTDFTAENGGTMVVPGSHKWDDDRGPRVDEAVPTVMSAGSALIWVGGTFHGGGTNTSDSNRIGLTIGLDLGYLRQEENAYLTYSTEVVKNFDEDIQHLLGWSVCPPGTGFVEYEGTMADPIFLLKDEGSEVRNSYADFNDDAAALKA